MPKAGAGSSGFLKWGRVLYLPGQLAAQDARQAEDARTQQQNAAWLRSRSGLAGAEREGFPAITTPALLDTTYRELARRGTVVDVPPVKPGAKAVIGTTQG